MEKLKLKNIVNKSYYTANGYINTKSDFNTLERYILYNLSVLNEFKGIVIATTYSTYTEEYTEINTKLWKKYFPNCILLDIPINRGHSFGIADSENAIIEYCKENNIDWICKSSNDVIIEKSVLDKDVPYVDFYYLNGIGYGIMTKYNFNFEKMIEEIFFPQTNFYLIDVSKIDYLYDREYVNQTYNYIQSIKNYNGKVWEYISGWECERFLKNAVERGGLSKFHLIPMDKYLILLNTVKHFQIHDSSHKNIMIEGICHFQYPDKNILKI